MDYNQKKNVSKPAHLHSLPTLQTKKRYAVKLVLVVGGLILLAWGASFLYQYQFRISFSLPIQNVRAAPPEPTKISTPPFRLTRMILTTTPLPDNEASEVTPTPTPMLTPTFTPIREPGGPTPEATLSSLANNPLPVIETVTPFQATATPETTSPAVSSPTRIVAKSINLDAKVIEIGWKQVIENSVPTSVWEVADYAAGWHKNSKLPGQGGDIVLSGHNNVKGEVFRYLVDLKPGDVVTLYVGEQPYEYGVTDIFILKDKGEPEAVRRQNAQWIGPFNEERLTLVTCWPYTNNTHRLIIIARPL